MIIIFNLDNFIFFMLDNCKIKNWHFIIKLNMFIKIAFYLKLIKNIYFMINFYFYYWKIKINFIKYEGCKNLIKYFQNDCQNLL